MSKFFVIVVEDMGDENRRFYSDPDRFMANTSVELPTDCEFRGCFELSDAQAKQLLREVV